MKRVKLTKFFACSLIAASILALNPICANAAWKQDNIGWWYTLDNSWAVNWKQIDGKWYYFNSNGYMAHDTTIDGCKLGSDGAIISTQIPSYTNNANEKIVDVTVSNAQEFVNAIGSNKRIVLKPGVYNLSDVKQIDNTNDSILLKTVQNEKELNIQNVHNLTIEGMEAGKVELKTTSNLTNVLRFSNVQNVTIKNIIARQELAKSENNVASVLMFITCANVSITNSEIYTNEGSGIVQINVSGFQKSNCKVDNYSI